MSHIAIKQPLRRCSLGAVGVALVLAAMLLSAAPSLAANVSWGITMTHENLYGRMGTKDPYTLNPGTFARESAGDVYTITVKNAGTEPSTAPPAVEVEDRLPAGIELAGTEALRAPSSSWTCEVPPLTGEEVIHEVSAASRFICKISSTLAPGESYPPITAEVEVSSKAAPPEANVATLVNKATVRGGGGTPVQAEAETTITPAVPFGIDSFSVNAGVFKGLAPAEELEFEETTRTRELYEKFTPSNQADGHPFELATDLALHHVPWVSGGGIPGGLAENNFALDVQSSGGNAKEVEVESAPGFLANVLSTPRCPIPRLKAGGCPANSIVGYTAVDLEEEALIHIAEEKEGKKTAAGRLQLFINAATAGERNILNKRVLGALPTRGLIYNMQPAPGNPAELGLEVDGQPILLEIRLRSNGNYGITTGDDAAGGNWPASDVTLCEYGAEAKNIPRILATPGHPELPEVPQPSDFRCKAESPGSGAKPFLTNPSECKTPLNWTVFTNSWGEPTNLLSKSVEANVEAERVTRATKETVQEGTAGELVERPTKQSELEGCGQLQFDPGIEFGPTVSSQIPGGTTQADAPTGAELRLKLPQEEASGNATPALRTVRMKLPEGMTVSPSAANGLQACTRAQFWPSAPEREEVALAEREEAEGKVPAPPPGSRSREPAALAECPEASQIATAEVFTPLLSGEPTVGGPTEEKVTCSPGMWTRGPWDATPEELANEHLSFSYQWLRDGQPIAGAEAQQESTAAPGDTGQAIQCQVTASNDGGSSVAVGQPVFPRTGGATIPPSPTPPLPIPPASIAQPSGIAAPGNELTCESGQWSGSPTFAYRWLRNGAVIAGAEGGKYLLRPEDSGKVIQCQVAGKNANALAIADSAAVALSPSPSPLPPLPGGAVQGQMFVGHSECPHTGVNGEFCTEEDAKNGNLFHLFIQLRAPLGELEKQGPNAPNPGLVVKLHGENLVNPQTGQQESVFKDQPQQPFYLLKLTLKGGPRAPLANPQTCGPGPAETKSTVIPWSASESEFKEDEKPEALAKPEWNPTSKFEVQGCAPTTSFSPSFNAGTTGSGATTAGANTNFTTTFGREDGEQDLSGVQVQLPLGLVGKVATVAECGEKELNEAKEDQGECPAASKIGTSVSAAGPGPEPFFSQGANAGRVYLTGPYEGAPFGIAVVTPAVSKAFNLGNVVVRSRININPNTAAVTVTSDPLPQFVDGVQLRLRKINVEVNREGFMINPTNCSEQHVSATLNGLQGASSRTSSKFGISGCQKLLFHPVFTATTQAHTSKLGGASLHVKLTYPLGSNYSNIAKSITDLPVQLPSRLETLHKACVDTVFEANPAACPPGSAVGTAIARTPVLRQPLTGPAYLVSHGGRAFPDLEFVLQGEGVVIVLDGHTDIKKGITRTTFESLPDSPVESFELNFPEGSNSILAANENLCAPTREATVKKSVAVRRNGHMVHVMKSVVEHVPEKLIFPTQLIGQNGVVLKQNTVVGVSGCPPTVSITNTTIAGDALLVTVKTSAKGTVTISGKGLRSTTKRSVAAGSHQIRVPFTLKGRRLGAAHKPTSVSVSVTVGKQRGLAQPSTVRL